MSLEEKLYAVVSAAQQHMIDRQAQKEDAERENVQTMQVCRQ